MRKESTGLWIDSASVSPQCRTRFCGCSLVVKLQPSKLAMRVRFPSPAPLPPSTRISGTRDPSARSGHGGRSEAFEHIGHIALIAVAKRFTAMNRVILIFNVGGFTMGFSG